MCKVLRLTPQLVAASDSVISDADDDATRYDSGTLLPLPTGTANNPTTADLGCGNPRVVTLLKRLDCVRIDALEGNITTLEFERSVKDLEIVVRQIEWFERRDHHVPFRLDTRVIPSDLP